MPLFIAKMADIDGVDVIETTFDWDSADVSDSGNLAVCGATTVAITFPCAEIGDGTVNFGGISIAALVAFVFSNDD